jgi:hypothetical protein
MPIDPNVFDKIRNYSDYARAEQDFQMRKVATAQQLETGDIDQNAKKLSLLGQIVGNNSIDQSTYDKARSYAQSQGLDTSALPDQFNPEVVNRLRFAGATPTAQLTALIATQGHQLKAGIATGDVGAYGYGGNNQIASAQPVVADPHAITPAQARTLPASGMMPTGQPDNYTPPALVSTSAPITPQIAQGDVPPSAPQNIDTLLNGISAQNSAPQFAFREKRPGETAQAYDSARKSAQDAYEKNPDVLKTQEKAKAAGKQNAKNEESSIAADEAFKQISTNLDSLESLTDKVPQERYFIPSSVQASVNQNLGDQTTANNYNAFKTINEAQGLNAIKELANTGQIRMNQRLEAMVARGYLVDPNASPEGKRMQIKAVRAELANARIAAQNVNARTSGGQVSDYESPTGSPKPGSTQQGTDGTYMFNGGDPAKPENWKKVK